MSLTLRLVLAGLLGLVVMTLSARGGLALWFTLPLAEGLRGALGDSRLMDVAICS